MRQKYDYLSFIITHKKRNFKYMKPSRTQTPFKFFRLLQNCVDFLISHIKNSEPCLVERLPDKMKKLKLLKKSLPQKIFPIVSLQKTSIANYSNINSYWSFQPVRHISKLQNFKLQNPRAEKSGHKNYSRKRKIFRVSRTEQIRLFPSFYQNSQIFIPFCLHHNKNSKPSTKIIFNFRKPFFTFFLVPSRKEKPK